VAIQGLSVGAPSGGLQLLLERLWRQEVTHEHVLAELFHHTELARVLGLWGPDSRPAVVVEPDRGIFDLALLDGAGAARLYIELKFAAASGWDQRERQRAFARAAGAERAYILLGTSFFEIDREPGVRYLGVPELLAGLAATAADGALGELQAAYGERLAQEAAAWSGEHDPTSGSHVAILRLYQAIADAWPVDVHPYRATNRGGPDWILNGDAWTTLPLAGWEQARLYWEISGGRVRFKLQWEGHEGGRRRARDTYERALVEAGRAVGIQVERTRRVRGHYMSAAQLPHLVREYVVIDGAVSAERAGRLYDEATAVFRAALERVSPLPTD
jgi:hypothetical protein